MSTATIIILALIKAGTWIAAAAVVAHIIVKAIGKWFHLDQDHKTGGLIPYGEGPEMIDLSSEHHEYLKGQSSGPHLHFGPMPQGKVGYSAGTHEDGSLPSHTFDSDTPVTDDFYGAYRYEEGEDDGRL